MCVLVQGLKSGLCIYTAEKDALAAQYTEMTYAHAWLCALASASCCLHSISMPVLQLKYTPYLQVCGSVQHNHHSQQQPGLYRHLCNKRPSLSGVLMAPCLAQDIVFHETPTLRPIRHIVGYNDDVIDLKMLDENHIVVATNSEQVSGCPAVGTKEEGDGRGRDEAFRMLSTGARAVAVDTRLRGTYRPHSHRFVRRCIT